MDEIIKNKQKHQKIVTSQTIQSQVTIPSRYDDAVEDVSFKRPRESPQMAMAK